MDLTLAAMDFWEVGLGLRRTSCDLDPAFSIGVLLVHCSVIEKKNLKNLIFVSVCKHRGCWVWGKLCGEDTALKMPEETWALHHVLLWFYHFFTSFYCAFHVQEVKPCPGAVVSSGNILKIRESLATVGAEAKSWDVTPVPVAALFNIICATDPSSGQACPQE